MYNLFKIYNSVHLKIKDLIEYLKTTLLLSFDICFKKGDTFSEKRAKQSNKITISKSMAV